MFSNISFRLQNMEYAMEHVDLLIADRWKKLVY
jgi:hypothetical protein